jgi:O-antigen/teichoic acid export membrane protein
VSIKSLFSKLTVITVLGQAFGAVINGLLIALLARKLDDDDFAIYIATVSLVTVFGSFTLGIRTITAHDYALSRERLTNGSSIFRSITLLVGIFAGVWLASSQIFRTYLQIPTIYLFIATTILVASVLGSYATGVLQGLRRFELWQKLVLLTTIIQIPLILFPVGRQLGVGYFLAILSIPSVCLFFFTFFITKNSFVQPTPRFVKVAIGEGLSLGGVTLMLQGPIFSSRLIDDSKISVTTASIGLLFLTLCGLSSTMGSYLLPDRVMKDDQTFSKETLKPHIIHTFPLLLAGVVLLAFGQNILTFVFGDKIGSDIPRPLMVLIITSYALWSIGQSLLNACINSLKGTLPYLLIGLAFFETCLLYLSRNNTYLFYSSFGIAAVLFLACILASFEKITKNS